MDFRTIPWKIAVGTFAALSAVVGVAGVFSILTGPVGTAVTASFFFASVVILGVSPWLRADDFQPRWHSMFAAFLIVIGALFAGANTTIMGEWSSVVISGVLLGLWSILEGDGHTVEITIALVLIGVANLFGGRVGLLDAVVAGTIFTLAWMAFFRIDRWVGISLVIIALGYVAGELFSDPQQIMSTVLMLGFAATGLTLARRYFFVLPELEPEQTANVSLTQSLPQVICSRCGNATPALVGLCGFCGGSLSVEPQPKTDDPKPADSSDNIIPFRKKP